MESKRFTINQEKASKILKNSLLFLAPVAILYLVFVQVKLGDGFDVQDLVPTKEVIGGMVLYVINTLLDILRKFVAGK